MRPINVCFESTPACGFIRNTERFVIRATEAKDLKGSH